MPLSNGTRLGPYEILAAIGAGGMGEVYKATDTNLKRAVAIKVLPASVAADAERLARFQREAEVLAALNHPHIAQIHGLEKSAGITALVMELIEGPTLADRIAQGPVPLGEALPIARQIAEALEAAHELGIIHRDLKPANIKVRDDGTVKVLDFGLAKALEPAGSGVEAAALTNSPTITSPAAMTQRGVILGTAAYMAPEQAKGRPVDKRADIWAFGCVLYEMLTGQRAFPGDDVSDTLAAVLRADPEWTALPSETPASIRKLLRRCLVKDSRQRLGDIRDARIEIEDAGQEPTAPMQPASARQRRPVWWMASTAVFALIAVAAASIPYFRESRPVETLRRLSVPLPEGVAPGYIALSPNGRQIVVGDAGVRGLWRRALDSTQFQVMPGTGYARSPFWSPDSRLIGFFADGKLKTTSAGGGPVQSLCDAGLGSGGTWNQDGLILFGNYATGSLDRVQASGGACSTVLKGDNTTRYTTPAFLPDGRHFLYLTTTPDAAKAGVYVASLDDLQGHRLLPDQSSAIFAPTSGGTRGHLLFIRDGRLLAQPFDARRLELTREPVPVAEDASFGYSSYQMAVSLATDATLAYLMMPPRLFQLTWLDRSGKKVGEVGTAQNERHVTFSPDERSVATVRTDKNVSAVWVHDLTRGVETRVASPGTAPVWSPDGRRLAFSSNNDLYVQDLDGAARDVLVRNSNRKTPSDWSRDGRMLVYTETDPKTLADIWMLRDPLSKGDKKPVPFLRTEFQESQGRLSPDGRWIAYTSDESGSDEIYVRPFPSGSGKWRISNSGGVESAWTADGRELFYLEIAGNRYRMVSVPMTIAAGGRFDAGIPSPLFELATLGLVTQANSFLYRPTKDGSRFLAWVYAGGTQTTVNVMTSWQQSVAGR